LTLVGRRDVLIRGGCAVAASSGGLAVSSCYTMAAPSGGDDFAPIQDAIERLRRRGGGTVRCVAGATYRCRRAPVVLDRVTLDLNGATLVLELSGGNDQGVRLRSHAVLRNGTVTVRSQGKPSLQGGAHAPVCVGPLYGEGGTSAQPSPDEGVSDWIIADLTLSTDKRVPVEGGVMGGVAIQVMGGATRGRIERIVVPDSTTMVGAIHLDWGAVGELQASDDADGMTWTRRAFDEGRVWTTHPSDIAVRDIQVGRLTGSGVRPEPGTGAIRLSGCHDVKVSGVRAKATSGNFLRHTAGDLGFEFAQGSRKLDGNVFLDCVVGESRGRLFTSDSLADNVRRATTRGYHARIDPLYRTDVRFEHVTGFGAGEQPGGVFVHQFGGRAVGCRAVGFSVGFHCDAGAREVSFYDCTAIQNVETGFLVENVADPPRDCRLVASIATQNGVGRPRMANIVVGASIATVIDGGTIGRASGAEPSFGIRIKERRDGCLDASIVNQPLIQSHAPGGAAIQASSREGWGAVKLFTGARYGAAVIRRWLGLAMVPIQIEEDGTRLIAVERGYLGRRSSFGTATDHYLEVTSVGDVADKR
jgi:hypothetical protein